MQATAEIVPFEDTAAYKERRLALRNEWLADYAEAAKAMTAHMAAFQPRLAPGLEMKTETSALPDLDRWSARDYPNSIFDDMFTKIVFDDGKGASFGVWLTRSGENEFAAWPLSEKDGKIDSDVPCSYYSRIGKKWSTPDGLERAVARRGQKVLAIALG